MGEFDQNIHWSNYNNGSTFELFLRKLRNAGFSDEFVDNFKIVLWDIPNGYYGSDTRISGTADGLRVHGYPSRRREDRHGGVRAPHQQDRGKIKGIRSRKYRGGSCHGGYQRGEAHQRRRHRNVEI